MVWWTIKTLGNPDSTVSIIKVKNYFCIGIQSYSFSFSLRFGSVGRGHREGPQSKGISNFVYKNLHVQTLRSEVVGT